MKKLLMLVCIASLLLFAGCDDDPSEEPSVFQSQIDLLDAQKGSDYEPPARFDSSNDANKGEKKTITYFSDFTKRNRQAIVFTPKGYDPEDTATTYPVLYLFHGIGGTHNDEWGIDANSRNIIENLIAENKAKPMIIVVPNVRAMVEETDNPGWPEARNPKWWVGFDNFIHDLTECLMPWMADNYNVKEGRESTAIAGFSMGGRVALQIGLTMPEKFMYVGSFAPASGVPLADDKWILPAEYMKNTFLLIARYTSDGVVGENPKIYYDKLIENKVPVYWLERSGGHDYVLSSGRHGPVRATLYWFAQCIF